MCSFFDSSDRLFIKEQKMNEKDYRVIPSHWKSNPGMYPSK